MGGFFVFEKKDCSANSDEKIVVQQPVKNKKIVHKTGINIGYMGGGGICLFLCLRLGGKKVCFWLRAKRLHREKNP